MRKEIFLRNAFLTKHYESKSVLLPRTTVIDSSTADVALRVSREIVESQASRSATKYFLSSALEKECLSHKSYQAVYLVHLYSVAGGFP